MRHLYLGLVVGCFVVAGLLAVAAVLAAVAVGSVVIAVAAVRVGSLSERRSAPEVRRRANNLAAIEASKRRAS